MRVIDAVVEAGAAALMACIAVLVICGVFYRYVLVDPIVWTEEVARLCLVWVTFLGMYLAYRRGEHIVLTVLVDKLPAVVGRIVRLLVIALTAAFMIGLVYAGQHYVMAFLAARSPVAGIPLGAIYAAIPVSGVLIVLAAAVRVAGELRAARDDQGPRSP